MCTSTLGHHAGNRHCTLAFSLHTPSSIFIILKFKRAHLKFSVYGRKQTDIHTCIHTHTRAQCSHASVGLTQARPNKYLPITSETEDRVNENLAVCFLSGIASCTYLFLFHSFQDEDHIIPGLLQLSCTRFTPPEHPLVSCNANALQLRTLQRH